jgi:hypothetical protein
MLRRTWLHRLALVVSGICISLALAEVILRVWTPSSLQYKRVRRSDPIMHHALRPSTSYTEQHQEFVEDVRVNSLGFRDREYDLSDSSCFRIIVLGDSFTEGVGVSIDSTFAKRLEWLLNGRQDQHMRFNVFNFGIAGYSPILELILFKAKGIVLHPQLVILCLDMSDVQEDVLYAEDAEFDSTGIPLKVNPSWPSFGAITTLPRGPLKTYVREHSYAFSLAAAFLDRVKPPPLVEAGNIHAARYMHTMDSTAERWEKFFGQSESYVKMIRDLCIDKGIAFALVTFPRGHQVNALEWSEGRKRWGLDTVTYNSAIFPSLESFVHRNGIPFLNMTPVFRARSKGDLYYPYDGHWTFAGHAVAADTLFDFLRIRHLIPEGIPDR